MVSQQLRFVRKIDDSEPRLLVSVCPACRAFVAASPSPKALRIAESAHRCKFVTVSRPLPRPA